MTRIYLIGVRGPNEQGNIAVDDIEFVDNSLCGVQPPEVLEELALLTTTVKLFLDIKYTQEKNLK